MSNKLVEDEYLGDGVYASFDGYHIILDLRAQDNTTRIALEPSVLANLYTYAHKAGLAAAERDRKQRQGEDVP